jgi:F0F1-type ATP synthase epsilon subunit
MAKTFHLTVARVGENLFDGKVISVQVPAEDGVMTVLAHHEAFVAPLKPGTISIESLPLENQSSERVAIELTQPGILEISSNQATIILQ